MNIAPAIQEWFVSETPEHPMTPAERADRRALLDQILAMPEDDVRAMVEKELRAAGGPGSGNFGHAGRPGEVGGSISSGLLASLRTSGGFTYHPVTHEQPKTGFALSLHKEAERVIPANEISVMSLAKYVKDNAALLTKSQNYLGAWLNPDDNNVYLDVSTIVKSPEEAERLAIEHQQLAYYDLENGVTVNVRQQKAAATHSRSGQPDSNARRVDPVGNSAHRPTADSAGDRGSEEDPRSLGGPGSGNFGHAGRPGEVGGSAAGDAAKFSELKGEWTKINDRLLHVLDQPNSPEAKSLVARQKQIVHEIHKLNVDTGGTTGLKQPGGARDIVIIGAGPGGLSTAAAGAYDGYDTLVLDENDVAGGAPKFSSRIENYPGFPMGVSGEQLSKDMADQAERLGAEMRLGTRVTGIEYDDRTGNKRLTLANGETIEARAVVIAGGVKFQSMDFPGADHAIVGDGKKLADAGKDKSVVVIGGSNGAAQAALGAAKDAKEVTVLSRSPIEKSMSDNQIDALRNHPKIKVVEQDEIQSWNNDVVTLKSGHKLNANALGIFIGGSPKTEWLPTTVKRTETGKLVADSNFQTSIPGVFAVGELRDGNVARIGAAVGDGQIVQRGLHKFYDELKARGLAEGGDARKTQYLENFGSIIDRAFEVDEENPWMDLRTAGGPGSGNFGHAGRPGEVGGSSQSFSADDVAEIHHFAKADIDAQEQKILREATTNAERKYAREMAVASLMGREALRDGDSKQSHTNPDGSYTSTRKLLHQQIAKEIFVDEPVKKFGHPYPTGLDNPVVTFFAGMPGAGKSTAAADLANSPNTIQLDADRIKSFLPEYNQGIGTADVVRESNDLADTFMVMAAQRRMNIVIDGTMKTSGVSQPSLADGALGKMAQFKDMGYRVEVRFVDVDANQSVENAVTRFHEQFQKNGFGRYVPPNITRSMADPVYGTKPRQSFELAKNTDYKGAPLIDAFVHVKGWTGDPSTFGQMIDSRGTLTAGGGRDR